MFNNMIKLLKNLNKMLSTIILLIGIKKLN